ncbi:hypothetical protein DAI22_11g169850 [Oryza sativa Japonica Group]|nr:hypothetical protein DAI22_11g169850 [Oryza sativa Japonica Group]
MAPHISFPSSSGAASFSFSSGGGLADREQRAHGGELAAAGYREWRVDGSELWEGGGIRWRRADGGAAVDQATAPAMATATTARRAAAAALGGERPRTLDPRPPTSWRPDLAVIDRWRRRWRPAVREEVVEVAKVSVAGSAVASAAGRRGKAPEARSGFSEAKLGGVGGREAREGAGGQIRLPGGQIWRPAVRRRRRRRRLKPVVGRRRRQWPGGERRHRRPDLVTGGQEVAAASMLKAAGPDLLEADGRRRSRQP